MNKGGRPKLKTLSEMRQRIGSHAYYYSPCETCGKKRYVRLLHGRPESAICISCANRLRAKGRQGEMNNNWKGGQYSDEGYVFVLNPQHPHAKPNGYIKRARTVLEEKLGRYLWPNAEPHHRNGVRDDDRPENLIELFHDEHSCLTRKEQINAKTKIANVK